MSARLLCVGTLALALVACGKPPAGYPPEYEFNFMQACEAQADAPGYCACVWDKIEAGVKPEDFRALEEANAAVRAQSPVQAQIGAYAQECRAATPSEPAAAPTTTP